MEEPFQQRRVILERNIYKPRFDRFNRLYLLIINYDDNHGNVYVEGCKISPLKHVVVVGAGITTGIKNTEFNNLKISNSKIGLKLTSINENNVIRDCSFRQNLVCNLMLL